MTSKKACSNILHNQSLSLNNYLKDLGSKFVIAYLVTEIWAIKDVTFLLQKRLSHYMYLSMYLSRRWQARPRNFTPSQVTASKSTNSIKLASIVIRNYVKMPKMTIFRHRKMHVRIELETWNFVQQLVHVKISSLQNFKYVRYREGCFLAPPFSNKFPW